MEWGECTTEKRSANNWGAKVEDVILSTASGRAYRESNGGGGPDPSKKGKKEPSQSHPRGNQAHHGSHLSPKKPMMSIVSGKREQPRRGWGRKRKKLLFKTSEKGQNSSKNPGREN